MSPEPSSVSDEQMITGIGRCAMIFAQKRDPVHPRHLDVEKDHVGQFVLQAAGSRIRIRGGRDDLDLRIFAENRRENLAYRPPNRPRSAREPLLGHPNVLRFLDPEDGRLNLLQARHDAVDHRFECPTIK